MPIASLEDLMGFLMFACLAQRHHAGRLAVEIRMPLHQHLKSRVVAQTVAPLALQPLTQGAVLVLANLLGIEVFFGLPRQ